ncbi:MAG: hypothetical protein KME17_18210 [Cyanosarcina radialis HA8281-LM2]|jgi:hypothetical protein|nr:hypothetical protein [Cyanosarcina radialis HA8281-LM2]
MLYLMAVWTILLVVCSVAGGYLIQLSSLLPDRFGDRWFLSIWLGLVVLSVVLLATSIALPLSPIVGMAIAFLLCLLALLSPQTRNELISWKSQFSRTRLVWLLAVMVAIAAMSSQAVTWIDTGLYHYSTIRWLADFGAVPGVALLFANFGFTSAWFALAAPFNPEFLGSSGSAVANGFVFLVVVLQFLVSLVRCFQNRARRSDWFIVAFFSVVLPLVIGFSLLNTIRVSASPDFPVLVLTGIIAWSIVLPGDRDRSSVAPLPDTSTMTLILAAGMVAMKLIALPLLIVASLQFLVKQVTPKPRFSLHPALTGTPLPSLGEGTGVRTGFKIFKPRFDIKRILLGAIIVSSLILPQLVHSAITSGCPLFPSSLFCLDVPWSPSASAIQRVTKATQQWTTWYGAPPAGVNPWVWKIVRLLTDKPLDRAVAVLMVVAILAAIYVAVRAVKLKQPEFLWVLAIAVSGMSFVMMTAPFFRFHIGYLILMPTLAIAIYVDRHFKLPSFERNNRSLNSILGVTGCFVVSAIVVSQLQGNYSKILLPPPLQPVKTTQKQINDLTYYSPQGLSPQGLCWATRLPCAFTVKNVRLRDPNRGIRAGFIRNDVPKTSNK